MGDLLNFPILLPLVKEISMNDDAPFAIDYRGISFYKLNPNRTGGGLREPPQQVIVRHF